MELFHCLYIIIFLRIIKSSNSNQIYRIKFGLFNLKNDEPDSSLINNIYYNKIYLNLSIGTPPQTIPFILDSDSQTFCVSDDFFNSNKSSSFERISIGEVYYKYEDVIKGFNAKDILNINNNKKKINFILGKGTRIPIREKDNYGLLGLRIPQKVQYGVYPFFHSLKNAELINTFIWTLNYFNNISLFEQIIYNKNKDNIIGEFIFGDNPSNYEKDKNKYDQNEFYEVNALPTPSKDPLFFWDIDFNGIYLTFNENQNNKNNSVVEYNSGERAQITIDLSYILCSFSFFQFLKINFFKDFLSNKKCTEKKLDVYYYYIECDSDINIKSFPEINLESRGLHTIFNLTYEDLFIKDEKNNKYIFLMFTRDHLIGTKWVLGTPFLRKYQFVFNEDSKTIGYYRNNIKGNNKDNNLKEINESKNNKTTLIIILIVILAVSFTIIGMFIQRKFFNKNRKIRANELEENFSYEGKNNNDDNNNNNKIIKDDNENNTYFNL